MIRPTAFLLAILSALALSPADVRSIFATPTGKALARETALLLAERLPRQPDVVLLERAAAANLARETALGKPGAFWAGSYLVSGSVEPPLDGGGPLAFNASGQRAKSAMLIDGLIAQAARKLTLAAVPPAGHLAKAARSFAESRAARASGPYLAALTTRKPLFIGEPFTASILDSISYVVHQAWERAPTAPAAK